MRPQADPYRRSEQRIARRRIELDEPAPQAAVLVPGHEQRAMTARTALAVHDLDRIDAGDAHSGIADSAAQVQVLGVQEVTLVEAADAIEYGARQVHQRSGHGVDVLDRRP